EGALADVLAGLDRKAAALEGSGRRRGERPAPGPREPSFARLTEDLHRLLQVLQGADVAPTTQAVAACEERRKALGGLLGRWEELTGKEVKAVNEQLRKANLPALVP